MRSGSGISSILEDIFQTGHAQNTSEVDELTGLVFEDDVRRTNYYLRYVISSTNTLEDIKVNGLFFEEEKLCKSEQRSRTYLIQQEKWLETGEEFKQQYSIQRQTLGEVSSETLNSIEDKEMPKVVADEDFPCCGLTGEKFVRVFDEKMNEWVFLNAIRPEKDGQIYLASAYEQNNSEEEIQSSKRIKLG